MAEYTTTARPYARAAYQHAKETSSVDNWNETLALLSAVVTDASVSELLDNPQMGRADKGAIILKVVGDQLSQQQQNLIKLMAENGRLKALPDVAEQFEAYRADAEGKVEAEVVSAFDLTDEQTNAIKTTLKSKLGREVSLTTSTDADLIGGVVIKAGDTIIDGSMRSQLEALSLSLSR